MSFYISFIAETRDTAADHLVTLSDKIPGAVYDFVHAALMNIRQSGSVSVTAQGHLCTTDANSFATSTATIEVKPLESIFIKQAPTKDET